MIYWHLRTLTVLAVLAASCFARDSRANFLDTTDREAVRSFYNTEYLISEDAQTPWAGDLSIGDAGDTDPEFKEMVLRRVNWFRRMAGVPAEIEFTPELNRKAQLAAMITASNGELNHRPGTDATNYTAEGAEAAANSNLTIGTYGPEAITSYMREPGTRNFDVGHRVWLLNARTLLMGTGDVLASGSYQSANALWVVGNTSPTRPPTRDEFIAWPPPGYFPYQLSSARWSISYPGADFSEASVAMTKDGAPWAAEFEGIRSSPESTFVWVPAGLAPDGGATLPKPQSDTTYTVEISNVLVDGAPRTFSYEVTVFDPTPPPRTSPPAVAWQKPFSSASAPAASGQAVYFQTQLGLLSLNAMDGSTNWLAQWGSPENSPVAGNELVYIGQNSPRGGLYALNAGTGKLEWLFFTGADVQCSPALAANGMIYFGTGHQLLDGKLVTDGKLYAADAATGLKKWEFTAGGDIEASPVISADGTIYFGTKHRWVDGNSTLDGKLYALNATTGELKWAIDLGVPVSAAPAIGDDNTLYLGSRRTFFAIDGSSGEQRWSFTTSGDIEFSSPVIDSAGAIYFGTLSGRLYALNATDGSKLWSFDAPGRISSPAVVAGGDLVIVPSNDGNLYALRRADGALEWVFETGGSISKSSPVITANDLLAFGWQDKMEPAPGGGSQLAAPGKLVALAGVAAEASATWPTFGQNPARTGTIHTVAAQPLRISNWRLDSTGLHLTTEGGTGAPIALQESTDLSVWTDLQVLTPVGGTAEFEVNALDASAAFLRLVETR